MTCTWAALMPHPPIIIPQVGRGREREAASTLAGMERLCDRVSSHHLAGNTPDVLFVLSPHQAYTPGFLFINSAPRVTGSLAPFGAPGVRVAAEIADSSQQFVAALRAGGIPVSQGAITDITKDHGSLVPLCCLARTFEGGKIPPLVMAGPSGLSLEHALLMGRILADLPQQTRWALLSSGDLSHRLKPSGPGGFHPDGALFDQAVVKALQAGDPSILSDLPPSLLENAGECGLRSVLILLGLCAGPIEVLSYEGPFGVGYCNALWLAAQSATAEAAGTAKKYADSEKRPGSVQNSGADAAKAEQARPTKGHPYARLARLAVERQLRDQPAPDQGDINAIEPEQALWAGQRACFVSIKGKDGSLRGCIGTILPAQGRLAQEIMTNAVSAAVRDPRFAPMQAKELDTVVISVDVLSLPEAVQEGMELDPRIWGVIVTQGSRRGVLLPDLPGIDSVEQQISIAAQKAGIRDLDGIRLQRFSVNRYYED